MTKNQARVLHELQNAYETVFEAETKRPGEQRVDFTAWIDDELYFKFTMTEEGEYHYMRQGSILTQEEEDLPDMSTILPMPWLFTND